MARLILCVVTLVAAEQEHRQLPRLHLPPPPAPAPRSEDFFMTQEGNSIDEAYFEEEVGMEEDDDAMRLYLDSADVQVGGPVERALWQAASVAS